MLSPLAVLEALAGAGLTGLLAFLLARVAREEAVFLELGAQRRVDHQQRAGDAVAHRAGLTRLATTAHVDGDVELGRLFHRLERLADDHHRSRAAEVDFRGLAVDGDLTGARSEQHARDRVLAPTGAVCLAVNRGHLRGLIPGRRAQPASVRHAGESDPRRLSASARRGGPAAPSAACP